MLVHEQILNGRNIHLFPGLLDTTNNRLGCVERGMGLVYRTLHRVEKSEVVNVGVRAVRWLLVKVDGQSSLSTTNVEVFLQTCQVSVRWSIVHLNDHLLTVSHLATNCWCHSLAEKLLKHSSVQVDGLWEDLTFGVIS